MSPKVSIIIPFYNDPFVDQALASAVSQTYGNLEIIVVDDGSTLHQQRITPFLDRVHYLGKSNGGTASALNHGIRVSSGQYIAWLSSDDLFYPHKIARQIEFMLHHQSRISFTAFDQINEHNQMISQGEAARFPSMKAFIQSFRIYNPINGCTVMLRRDLIEKVGYFDESRRYTQDYDYWMRVVLARETIHFLDESLTLYRWHGQMGTLRFQPQVLREIRILQNRYSQRLKKLAQTVRS